MQKTSTIAIAAALAAFTASAAVAQDQNSTTPNTQIQQPSAVPTTEPATGMGTDTGTGMGTAQTPALTNDPATGVAETPAMNTDTMTTTTATAGTTEPFIQRQEATQFLGSELMGADVVSAADEDIGEVNDVLFDQDGRPVAILVGIGGFLGIGEKDVAIPFERLTVQKGDAEIAATDGAGTVAPMTGTDTVGTNTGTVGVEGGAVDMNEIRITLETTREELEGAPAFERYEDAAMTGATTEGVAPLDGTAPGGVDPVAPMPEGGTAAPSTAQ